MGLDLVWRLFTQSSERFKLYAGQHIVVQEAFFFLAKAAKERAMQRLELAARRCRLLRYQFLVSVRGQVGKTDPGHCNGCTAH